MKLKKIPLSKAKTAWGLLQDVKRAITEEPKRANIEIPWGTKRPKQGGPACGTVGCFNGWIGFLSGWGMNWDAPYTLMGRYLNYYFESRGEVFAYFNAGSGDACGTTSPGTRAHARAVVARINRFMKANEVALKARKLKKVDGRLEPVQ